MTIKHMEIFITVYENKSITKAAGFLHMTQPAVSRAIKEIEEYYGLCLFERINRGISPTECSHQLYHWALHLTDTLSSMERDLRNWDSFGILRVGSSITIGNSMLTDIICRFKETHLNIKVHVSISNRANLQSSLLRNRLDIALIEGGSSNPSLHSEVFAKDCLVPVLPYNHPLSQKKLVRLEDLTEYDFLARERGSSIRTYVDNLFAINNITLAPLWESISTQAIIKAVHNGIGISILPCRLVNNDILSGFVSTCKVLNMDFSCQHHIVWHKDKFLTPFMLDFIKECRGFMV